MITNKYNIGDRVRFSYKYPYHPDYRIIDGQIKMIEHGERSGSELLFYSIHDDEGFFYIICESDIIELLEPADE